MNDIGIGAGLGALGFWTFIAAIVVAGIWESIRKRDAQHETLRRIIESGQTLDETTIDKLLSLSEGNKQLDQDLKIGGLICLFLAPGLAALGWFMSLQLAEELLTLMLGVATLMIFIAIGLLVAAKVVARSNAPDDGSIGNQS